MGGLRSLEAQVFYSDALFSFVLFVVEREATCCCCLNAYNIANPIEDCVMAAFG